MAKLTINKFLKSTRHEFVDIDKIDLEMYSRKGLMSICLDLYRANLINMPVFDSTIEESLRDIINGYIERRKKWSSFPVDILKMIKSYVDCNKYTKTIYYYDLGYDYDTDQLARKYGITMDDIEKAMVTFEKKETKHLLKYDDNLNYFSLAICIIKLLLEFYKEMDDLFTFCYCVGSDLIYKQLCNLIETDYIEDKKTLGEMVTSITYLKIKCDSRATRLSDICF